MVQWAAENGNNDPRIELGHELIAGRADEGRTQDDSRWDRAPARSPVDSCQRFSHDDSHGDCRRRVVRVRDVPLGRRAGPCFCGLLLLPVWATLMAALAWQLQRWRAGLLRFSSYRVDQAGIEIVTASIGERSPIFRDPGCSTPTCHKARSNARTASARSSSTPPGRHIQK